MASINEELEFKQLYNSMPKEEQAIWLPKEIFFLSKKMSLVLDTQEDQGKRLVVIESNCKKALCEVGINEQQSIPLTHRDKRTALAKGVGIGGGSVVAVYFIAKGLLALIWNITI